MTEYSVYIVMSPIICVCIGKNLVLKSCVLCCFSFATRLFTLKKKKKTFFFSVIFFVLYTVFLTKKGVSLFSFFTAFFFVSFCVPKFPWIAYCLIVVMDIHGIFMDILICIVTATVTDYHYCSLISGGGCQWKLVLQKEMKATAICQLCLCKATAQAHVSVTDYGVRARHYLH